jgi:hypothetical protein
MVGEGAKRRGGSRAEASRATQPLGGGDGLAPTAIRGEEVKELGRLGDHRANSFAFDESRGFETYRTRLKLVKQFVSKRGIIAEEVRWRSKTSSSLAPFPRRASWTSRARAGR